MTSQSNGPGPVRIGPVQIFKVTGPVGPFFGWTVRSLTTTFIKINVCPVAKFVL